MSINTEVEVEFLSAYWDCPKCGEISSDTDAGVDDNGDAFEVVCNSDVDDGVSDEMSKCGHEYTVKK